MINTVFEVNILLWKCIVGRQQYRDSSKWLTAKEEELLLLRRETILSVLAVVVVIVYIDTNRKAEEEEEADSHERFNRVP